MYRRDRETQEDIPEMKRRERFRRPSQQQSAKVSTRRSILLALICTGFAICVVMMARLQG